MKYLEFFYENPPQIKNFLPRKKVLSKHNTLLYGPSQGGKSYLCLDYLHQSDKNFLYLDLGDIRVTNFHIGLLCAFVKENNIEILALDNYNPSFNLPELSIQIILIARQKIMLEGFVYTKLYSFDFEEFLSTTQKTTTQSFNLYLKNGALDRGVQTLIKASLDENIVRLLSFLCTQCSKPLSVNQVYLQFKKEHKVSKDWLYRTIDWLVANNYIYFIAKTKAPKAQKKLFVHHQPFLNALTLNTGFIALFQNLVVNELVKKGFCPSYYELTSYLIGSKLIKVDPFAGEEAIWVKIQKNFGEYKKLGVTSITIITVSSSFEFEIENVKCEAMPFYEWAVLDEF
ncbi:MAG: hypothetical protein ACQESH_00010 [Campylobacterota bacterium]